MSGAGKSASAVGLTTAGRTRLAVTASVAAAATDKKGGGGRRRGGGGRGVRRTVWEVP